MPTINRLSNKLADSNSRIVKRCFMTGKQCIFSSVIAEKTSRKIETDDQLSVFIIMPFKPNLETFYQWSLKPYLMDNYGLLEKNIQRASDVMGMEYIVCEKICKKIQESDLVIADISVENSNVFYEIGLAYGLHCPVILMQKEGIKDLLTDPRIKMSLSYNNDYQDMINHLIYKYRTIEKIKDEPRNQLETHIIKPNNQTRNKTKMRISVLDFSLDFNRGSKKENDEKSNDIIIGFPEILIGAIDASMQEIKFRLSEKINKDQSFSNDETIDDVWHQIYHNINWKEDFLETHVIKIDGTQGYEKITQDIESSFCNIIDVTPDTPNSTIAYFWLGYCHSRGLNVIPVFRMKSKKEPNDPAEKLAFDIRSLWYADYYEDEPYKFKKRIREILEYLLMRDIPDRQKRDFWDRFSPEKELKVFTGAIHVEDLMREVVGDWDVRTVSEIFSYLPLIRETTAPRLVSPFYSPEEAYKRFVSDNPDLSEPDRKERFINKFNGDIERQLENSSAIVIASPDVNPVTEFLLNKIYKVTCDDIYYKPFMDSSNPNFDGYVVIKEKLPKIDTNSDIKKFTRLFYQERIRDVDDDKEKLKRGFALHRHLVFSTADYMEEYYNQAENVESFKLLGHLLVTKYPQDSENYIILLNGVSGPATFALAQILTGGGSSPNMNSKSEEMLYEVNKRLDDPKKPNVIGVQGIVEIEIARGFDSDDGNGVKNDNYITNVDSRRVISWNWYKNHPESIYRS